MFVDGMTHVVYGESGFGPNADTEGHFWFNRFSRGLQVSPDAVYNSLERLMVDALVDRTLAKECHGDTILFLHLHCQGSPGGAAATRSPHSSSGRPTTATSRMAGWRRRTSSISSAESL